MVTHFCIVFETEPASIADMCVKQVVGASGVPSNSSKLRVKYEKFKQHAQPNEYMHPDTTPGTPPCRGERLVVRSKYCPGQTFVGTLRAGQSRGCG